VQYPRNPSWEIASRLPKYLPADQVKIPGHRISRGPSKVKILVHPEAVRVNYDVVRDLVPTFWDEGQKIDFAIHIGMAGPEPTYALERLGHRDGYMLRDVDGNLLGDDERQREEGDDWIWSHVPEEIVTDLDIENVYKRWVERSPV
jgi:pyroglutamyl-peptidase